MVREAAAADRSRLPPMPAPYSKFEVSVGISGLSGDKGHGFARLDKHAWWKSRLCWNGDGDHLIIYRFVSM